MKKLKFTWQQFRDSCKIVADKIEDTGENYTQIIAIARGGFYLGDYLSRRLNLPLSVIIAQSYSRDNQQENLSWGNLSYIEKPSQKILLVDDLLDTGKTMITLKKQLENDWHILIDTAVVWQKSHSKYQANYYSQITDSDSWIIQPFEVEF